MKTNSPFYDKRLKFDEAAHLYTYNSIKLKSVTTVIHEYCKEFDEDGSILARCAKREGISEAELQAQWHKERDDSNVYGTAVHAAFEHFIDNNEILPNEHADLVTTFRDNYKFKGKLYSEVRLFNIHYGIAGTADLVEFLDDNTINIYDFKTNKAIKDFSFKGKDGKCEKMLPPLECFMNCNLYHYQVQLSTYAYMMQLARPELKVEKLQLFHLDKNTRKIKPIPLFYCKKRVKMMLDDYYDKNYF